MGELIVAPLLTCGIPTLDAKSRLRLSTSVALVLGPLYPCSTLQVKYNKLCSGFPMHFNVLLYA